MKLMTDCDCYICTTPWNELTEKEKRMACAPIHGHPTFAGFILMAIICTAVILTLQHFIV